MDFLCPGFELSWTEGPRLYRLNDTHGPDRPGTRRAVRPTSEAAGDGKFGIAWSPGGMVFPFGYWFQRDFAMRGRTFLIVLLCTPVLGGCGALQRPDAAADGWLTRVRRQMDQAAREIQADLDFHETEGLEEG